MKLSAFLASCLLFLAAGSAQSAGNTLNISYVKSPFNLQMIVMKEHGLLEKELAPLGVSVNWPEITSGSRQAQALAAGDLDVAGVMNSISLLMGASEGLPLKMVAGVARPTDVFAIVGKKGGVTSMKELKGKTVAGPKGTVLHQLLVAALAKEGMNLHEVTFVQMDIPQAFAALQGGKVDAALLAANMVIKAQQEGAIRLATATGHVAPLLGMVASDRFITEHPDRLNAVLTAHDKAWQWIAANHSEAIALGAKIQGVTHEEAEQLFAWSHFVQRVTPEDVASMQKDMAFLMENGMMRRKVTVSSLVRTR